VTEYDQTYKEQFDLLTFHTNEYAQSVPFVEQTIIPKLSEQQHFLDVGAGRGTFTMPMSRHFEQTTIVEPNTVYFNEVADWAKGAGINFSGYNADWLKVDSSNIQADLVVLSHVLYFVPSANRSRLIRKAYDAVKPGGYMILILISATSGITRLYRSLLTPENYREMPCIEETVVNMHREGYDNMHLTLFDADIHLPTLEEMYELIDFLVTEKIAFDTDENIQQREAYINDYLKTDMDYSINSNIGVLAIHKR
jgi:SAM-dependent methyltransferase